MRTYYRHLLPWLQGLLLIASLLWTLWFVFAGFGNHMDPAYWLYKYRHLDGGWMSAATILFGHLCVRLFGEQLLPLRLVGWVLTVLAIALPYGLLLTPRQRRQHLHWLALAYFMMGYGAFQELSPGTLTVFLLSLLAVAAIRYLRQARIPTAIALGLLLALAIAARFPNILVLIPLIAIICLRAKRSNSLSGPIAIALSTISALSILYALSFALLSFSTVDPAMGSSHGFTQMLTKLWEQGALLIGFALLWYGVLALVRRSWYWSLPLALAIAYVAAYTFTPQWYNTHLTICLSAACVVFAIASRRTMLAWFTAILAVATLGTDVAWLKLFPCVLALIPLVPTAYHAKTRTGIYLVLLAFTIVQMSVFATNSVGNSNLTEANIRAAVPPYENIHIDSVNNARITQLNADLHTLSLNDSNTLAVGQDLHLIRSVTGCRAGYHNEFWSNIFDSVYTAKYEPLILERQPIVICSYSPHFKTKKTYRDRHSAFEQMLLRNHYSPLDRSTYRYMIYLPQTDLSIHP